MQYKLFFRSTLRQPLRTLFLFLVVGLCVFMTVSRTSEYFVLERETDRLSSYYRSIGTVEVLGDEYDAEAAIDYIKNDPRVEYVDGRYRSSGVLQDEVFNADNACFGTKWNYSFYQEYEDLDMEYSSYDVLFYGTLEKAPILANRECEIAFTIDEVLVGYPEHVASGMKRYVKASAVFYYESSSYSVGERYLVRARFDPEFSPKMDPFGAGMRLDLMRIMKDGDWMIAAPNNINLDDAAYADLKKEAQIIYDNQHAVKLVPTVDMSAMPDMQEAERKYQLLDGRMLDHEDDAEGKKVCVIDDRLASVRGLQVGDTVHMTLRNLMASNVMGYVMIKEDIDAYGDYDTAQETLEIVGIVKEMQPNEYWYSNQLYVPESLIPSSFDKYVDLNPVTYTMSSGTSVTDDVHGTYTTDEEEYTYSDGILQEVSFVLTSPKYEDAFLRDTADELAKLGIRTVFMETGYENFRAMSEPMLKSSFINAIIYSALSLLVIVLLVFIYFRLRKKDFAIARAMGASNAQSTTGAVLPLLAIGLLGAIVGGVIAWQSEISSVQSALSKFSELGLETTKVAVQATTPLAVAGIVFIALLIIAAIFGLHLSRRPVLELMQGGARNAK